MAEIKSESSAVGHFGSVADFARNTQLNQSSPQTPIGGGRSGRGQWPLGRAPLALKVSAPWITQIGASARCSERRLSVSFQSSLRRAALAGVVKGFGCRPSRGLSAGTEGRRPKASREGTRGGRREGCRQWRFDRRATPASDARVGGTDRGCPTAADAAKALRFSRGRFGRDERHSASV